MEHFKEARVKLKNTKRKNKNGATLRIPTKKFQGEKLPHELLLTATQKTKVRHAFKNNMLKDIKHNKTQLFEIIQSGGFLGYKAGKLSKEALLKSIVPLAKYTFPQLANRQRRL